MSEVLSYDRNEMIGEEFYTSGWEHFADELKRLDLRISILLVSQQHEHRPETPFEQLKGLVLTEEEVYRLLGENISPVLISEEVAPLLGQLDQLEAEMQRKRVVSGEKGIFLPLVYVSNVFDLTPFEEQCIVIGLAVELDRKYEKLYAYLQDDVTCKSPTVDLAMKLLCTTMEEKLAARPAFATGGKLFRYFFKKQSENDSSGSLLSRLLRLDERIISFLLDAGQVDQYISSFASMVFPVEDLFPLLLDQDVQERMRKFVEDSYHRENSSAKGIVFYLYGPPGAGKKLQARHFCRHFNQPMMIVDLVRAVSLERTFAQVLDTIGREAILQQAVLCFDNFNALLSESDEAEKKLKELLDLINIFSGVVFLLSDCSWKPAGFDNGFLFIDIEFNVPQDYDRKRLWEHFGKGCRVDPGIDWGTLAGKFRFTAGQIRDALVTAEKISGWSQPVRGYIGAEELYKACYAQVRHRLGQRATRIQPKYTWDDIILPPEQKEQLRNVLNQVKYRHIVYGQWGFGRKLSYGKGLSVLYAGPPGTGKTMSAQVLARELYLELYKIDLAQVVSKYIGETEKNLQEIFKEAQTSNAILFFDEADALFGKRSEVKDAHDRYANIETSFLLQKVEEYEGITILATNYRQNIDDAFVRRINFIIEFPFPNAGYREKIWRSMIPEEAPVSEDVDFRFIAGKFEVSGGNIKNIVVSAAFLAAEASEPIGMKHIIRSAKYELQKMGKILLKEDLGEYKHILDD